MTNHKLLKILIVDDDPIHLALLKKRLNAFDNLVEASSYDQAVKYLQTCSIDLAFFDLDLEERAQGLKLVELAHQKNIYSVIVSANKSDDIIKRGYISGCFDYLAKPASSFDLERILFKHQNYCQEKKYENLIYEKYITANKQLKNIISNLKYIHLSNSPLLITGESGTGKEVIAQIAFEILKPKGKFVALSGASLSSSLIMSELFGHKKGAFTGAHEDKKGLVEVARDGVLFLDELHLLPMEAQQALLRFVETKEYRRVGDYEVRKSETRIIAAARENLQELVANGDFKDDLYYRLRNFHLSLTPLRERKEDIELQLEYFIKKFFGDKRKLYIGKEVKEKINQHSFKEGNTRELMGLVESWYIKSKGMIEQSDLPFFDSSEDIFQKTFSLSSAQIFFVKNYGYDTFMKEVSRSVKDYALSTNSSQTSAANFLKVGKSTLSKFKKSEHHSLSESI